MCKRTKNSRSVQYYNLFLSMKKNEWRVLFSRFRDLEPLTFKYWLKWSLKTHKCWNDSPLTTLGMSHQHRESDYGNKKWRTMLKVRHTYTHPRIIAQPKIKFLYRRRCHKKKERKKANLIWDLRDGIPVLKLRDVAKKYQNLAICLFTSIFSLVCAYLIFCSLDSDDIWGL